MRVGCYGTHRLGHTHSQLPHHIIYNKYKGGKHARGLERVGPYERLYSTTTRVQPYKQRHATHRHHEGHAYGIEHKTLQNDAHHIETYGGSRHLRHEEKPRSRLVRTLAKTPLQIGVDGGEIESVINRQQHKGYDEISQDESYTRLDVGHVDAHGHARHTDKRYARD